MMSFLFYHYACPILGKCNNFWCTSPSQNIKPCMGSIFTVGKLTFVGKANLKNTCLDICCHYDTHTLHIFPFLFRFYLTIFHVYYVADDGPQLELKVGQIFPTVHYEVKKFSETRCDVIIIVKAYSHKSPQIQ